MTEACINVKNYSISPTQTLSGSHDLDLFLPLIKQLICFMTQPSFGLLSHFKQTKQTLPVKCNVSCYVMHFEVNGDGFKPIPIAAVGTILATDS